MVPNKNINPPKTNTIQPIKREIFLKSVLAATAKHIISTNEYTNPMVAKPTQIVK